MKSINDIINNLTTDELEKFKDLIRELEDRERILVQLQEQNKNNLNRISKLIELEKEISNCSSEIEKLFLDLKNMSSVLDEIGKSTLITRQQIKDVLDIISKKNLENTKHDIIH